MANTVYSVILLCLVLHAKLSTTILLDGTTEVLPHNSPGPEGESTFAVLGEDLRREEDTKYVLSVMSVFAREDFAEENHGRRVKRSVIKDGKCSEGWVKVGNGCITEEQFIKLQQDDKA